MNYDEFVFELFNFLKDRYRLVRILLNDSNQIIVTVEFGENVGETENQITEFIKKSGQKEIPEAHVEEGYKLRELIGKITEEPPLSLRPKLPIMGGDACGNIQSPGYYGTLSFIANSIILQASGFCNFSCSVAPGLMSCNHVIGRSDAGQPGEGIWAGSIQEFGTLNCLVPFRCRSSSDVATAIVRDLSQGKRGFVREIGQLTNDFRRPNIGERVRKYGARTGLKSGTITGKGIIHVGDYDFFGVFFVSGKFACPGDSGSPVVADDGILLGINSWGQSIPCDQDPYSVFWPILNPGTKTNRSEINIVLDGR